MKTSNPRQFYSIVKKIGCLSSNKDFNIEEFRNLSEFDYAEKIADHFAKISNEYMPVDYSKLPTYLPSPHPPQVTEADIYAKLKTISNTRSTHPIDLPNALRKEYTYF